MIDVIYADKDKKADDKIVEILKQMTPDKKKKVLLVTGDRLLIKDCQ
jgi:predicted RNA-binding protein with PIN domain